jgi:hypothetical protein
MTRMTPGRRPQFAQGGTPGEELVLKFSLMMKGELRGNLSARH